MEIKILRQWYQENLPILPPNSNFRHFRFRMWDERYIENGITRPGYFKEEKENLQEKFRKIDDTIHRPEDLQKWLVLIAPRDAYVGVSTWLKPVGLGRNSKRKSDYLLRSELVIDFDGEGWWDKLNAVHKFLSDKGLKEFFFVRTGHGCHVWCYDWFDKICVPRMHPKNISEFRRRENFVKQMKKLLVWEMEQKGIVFDKIHKNLIPNPRLIVRVPNTVHGETGKACFCTNNLYTLQKEISKKELPISYLLRGTTSSSSQGMSVTAR